MKYKQTKTVRFGKIGLASLLLALTLFLTFGKSSEAHAQTYTLISRHRVHMVFNCNAEPSTERAAKIRHGLCPSTSSNQPNITKYGDCGDSFIYGYSEGPGTGVIFYRFGVDDTEGPILGGNYDISWTGGNHGRFGNYIFANDGPSSFRDAFNLNTGSGEITADVKWSNRDNIFGNLSRHLLHSKSYRWTETSLVL